MNHCSYWFFLAIFCVFSNLSYATEAKVAAGRYHSLAVNNQGEVYWWGIYQAANYDLGLDEKPQTPTIVSDLPKSIAVAAGMDHSLAIAEDGGVFEWGFSPFALQQFIANNNVQALCKSAIQSWNRKGRNPCEKLAAIESRVQVPMRISNVPPAVAVAGGDKQSFMISKAGEVYCWNAFTAPKKVASLNNIKMIALGQFHVVALNGNGQVFTWGSNVNGELGYSRRKSVPGDFMCQAAEPRIAAEGAITIASGVNGSYALLKDGTILGAGREANSWLGDPDRAMDPTYQRTKREFRHIAALDNVSELAGGSQHMAFRTKDGEIYTMGYSKQLGTGQFASESTKAPVKVKNMASADSVVTSWDHTLAIGEQGYVCAWGQNWYGTVRADSKRREIPAPTPVIMKDGMPLNLHNNSALSQSICGDEQWKTRVALWDAADEKVADDSRRENALAKRLSLKLRIPLHSTALIEAARGGNKAAVVSLLDSCEVDINTRERYGKTAQEVALAQGYLEIVSLLKVAKGCNTK